MQLPLIDDARSIQKAISAVLNALATGTLDAKQARVTLYGLQIAATNARHIASQAQKPVKAVASDAPADEREDHIVAALEQDPPPQPETATAPVLPEAESAIAPQEETGRTTVQPPASAGIPASPPLAPGAERETAAKDTAEALASALPVVIPENSEAAPKPPVIFSTATDYRSPHRERMLARRRRLPTTF